MFDKNVTWMNETIPDMKKGNWFYRFICFCMGKRKKKLTYNDMFILIYGVNLKEYGEDGAKKIALNQILNLYKENHNGQLPDGIEKKKVESYGKDK